MNNYKVYIHRDLEGNIFYVGCTKNKKRPYHKYNNTAKQPLRSIEWFNRCNNQFTVDIITENLTQEEAYEMETQLILKYGRECDGGILVNKTTGGYGCSGIKHSEVTKKKLKEAFISKNNPMYGKPSAKRKKVICTLTGKIWDYTKQCAEDNDINHNTLAGKLSGHKKNDTTLKYLNE